MLLEADDVWCAAVDHVDHADGADDDDDADDDTLSAASSAQAAGGGAPNSRRVGSKKDNGNLSDKQQCKCCQKWFFAEECGPHSPYCRPDKQAIDFLTYQAAKQGESCWFSEVRRDEGQLRTLVATCHDACPFEKAFGKRGTFSIAAFRREYAVKSPSIVRVVGAMTNKRQYVDLAGTAASANMEQGGVQVQPQQVAGHQKPGEGAAASSDGDRPPGRQRVRL